MLKPKNGRVIVPAMKPGAHLVKPGEMDYIRFGTGNKVMIMIPGVGDGLKTVKGMAWPFAILYRELARDFTVYVFSRRTELSPHTTTREMAEDLSQALKVLELPAAAVVGVSQGGMIAQWMAIDHPEQVEKLVLTVTLCKPNDTIRDCIQRWTEMAHRGNYKGIMVDTAERSYSEKKLRRERLVYRLLGSVGKPKSFERFLIQAQSCAEHDAYRELSGITCPTLVIGGEDDRIVTGEASREIAGRIPGSELVMYEGLGHGLYEEAGDFLERVAVFCR